MNESKKKNVRINNFFDTIERVGNKIPHPFWLFVILTVIITIISVIAEKFGLSVTYLLTKAGSEPKEVTVAVVNLLSKDVLQSYLVNFTNNYIRFAPIGIVVLMTLGIGIMEQTGMISALMRHTVLKAPSYLVAFVLALVGINSSIASNAGVIFTSAIGGAVYKALGKNPWVGIIIGFASANGGFTASFFISGFDTLLAGVTESTAIAMNIDAPTHPLINYFFMIVATISLAIVTTIIAEKFTTKSLGGVETKSASDLEKYKLTADELTGLKYTGIATIVFLVMIILVAIPKDSILRSAAGTFLPKSPFIDGIVAISFFLFLFIGIAYGLGAKVIKHVNDIPKNMEESLKSILSFLVVALPASIFINLFNISKLTTVLSVKGAELLQSLNFTGAPLIVVFIILCATINLFISSGTAKWLILAPIFVPMLAVMGFSPALTQLAFRIGDSSTNIISPLSYYLPIILGLFEQYRGSNTRKVGVGTIISLEIPYALAYFGVLTVQLIIWYFLNLPLGPGVFGTL